MSILWSKRIKKVFRFMMITAGLLALLYYMQENLRAHQLYLRDTETKAFLPCHNTPKHLRELVKLVEDASTVMESLNITNFLLYGSLWGVYRFQGPLPWDHDADIGIIGDRNYHDGKEDLIPAFEKKGIQARDDWISTSYNLKRGKSASLGIFVFNDYEGTMERPGLESWIGFIQFKLYHTFPSWMVVTPLPTMKFGWLNVRVPRGKREIFRHLYPFHWRLEFLPTACKKKAITMESLFRFVTENVNDKRSRNSGEGVAGDGTLSDNARSEQ